MNGIACNLPCTVSLESEKTSVVYFTVTCSFGRRRKRRFCCFQNGPSHPLPDCAQLPSGRPLCGSSNAPQTNLWTISARVFHEGQSRLSSNGLWKSLSRWRFSTRNQMMNAFLGAEALIAALAYCSWTAWMLLGWMPARWKDDIVLEDVCLYGCAFSKLKILRLASNRFICLLSLRKIGKSIILTSKCAPAW